MISASADVVEAVTPFRLSYEPKGEQLAYRTELRRALRGLKPRNGGLLDAIYETPNTDFADLENVLLYNVGAGAYRHLVESGLVCRRMHSSDQFLRVRYAVSEPRQYGQFNGRTLAKASLSSKPRGHGPADWWAAFRSRLEIESTVEYRGEYAITVEVGTTWTVRAATSALKPMLDGLVSALHVHDGTHRDHIVKVLGPSGSADDPWELLNTPDSAILGARTLLRPRATGVTWNPADERCAAFRVQQTTSAAPVEIAVTSI